MVVTLIYIGPFLMNRNRVGITLSALIFLLSVGHGFAAEGGKNKPVSLPAKKVFSLIVTGGETLQVKIKKTPLRDVLQELANQTDLLIEIDRAVGQELISAEFDPLPLEEGIQNLLRNKNYVLMYAEVPSIDGSATVVRVEGIKVAGIGGIGASPLSPIQREGPRGDPFPIPMYQENETSRHPQMDNPAIPDDPMRGKYGMIYPFPGTSLPVNPGVTNPAPDRIVSTNGNSYNSSGTDTRVYSLPPNISNAIPPDGKGSDQNAVIPSDKKGSDHGHDDDLDPSISSLTNAVHTSSDPEIRMDALDDLAYALEDLDYQGRLKFIPTLQQVARSDSNSDIRERAQEIIDEIRDDPDAP